MILKHSALVIVDMQNYYLRTDSSYYKYFNKIQHGCLDYIINRCNETVIPNISKSIDFFENNNLQIIYLKLCGVDPDRKDLHKFFRKTYQKGIKLGFSDVYPLKNSMMSEIIKELMPKLDNIVIEKTTYSPFTSTDINDILINQKIKTLVFTGLATSQCVETTARDASDYGYDIIHLEDAQADYDELSHTSSLISSQGVCGGKIFSTDDYIKINS